MADGSHGDIKYASITKEVRDITPSEATRLVGRARNKSGYELRLLDAFRRDMEVGAWKLNGDPIIIDDRGELLDGRLRLTACIESGKPFRTVIIKGISPDNFITIDSVRRRTAADVMKIRGEDDGRALAAALRLILRAGQGDLEKQSKQYSSHELIEVLNKNPTVRRSLKHAKSATPTLPHGLATALHFLFQNEDRQAADQFFDEFAQGAEGPKGAPFALWRALENIRNEGGRRSQKQQTGLALKAWRSYRTDNDAKVLRFNPDSEAFPEAPGVDEIVLPDTFDKASGSNSGADVSRLNDEIADTINIEVLEITPALAEEFLEKNDNNRKIAVGVMKKYLRDMEQGDWALNGQTIKIGRSGRLLDGQHRLTACVKSGKSFPAIVVRGLDEDVFETFDVGNKRAFSTILDDMGETNTALLAGALRQLWALDNDVVMSRVTAPSNNELLDALEKHPDIRRSLRLGNKFREVGSPSQLSALHYFFNKADAERANIFTNKLVTGVGISHAGDPALLLRTAYLVDQDNRKNKMSVPERMALAIKAWNYAWNDETLAKGKLKWTGSGDRSEPFPKVAGLTFTQGGGYDG